MLAGAAPMPRSSGRPLAQNGTSAPETRETFSFQRRRDKRERMPEFAINGFAFLAI
jgi:hypothetical protein